MNATSIKSIRISSDDLPEQGSLDVLREVYGRTIIKHDFEPIDQRPLRFNASLLLTPTLGLASGSSSPARFRRGSEHIDSDDLVLNVSLTGGRIVQQFGREAVVGEGEAVLTSCAEPGVATLGLASRFISIRVPRMSLQANVADFDACLLRPIARNNRALQLLTAYVAALWGSRAATAEELHEHVFAHVHDLLWTTLGATRDAGELAETRGVRAARLLAIKRDIADNLHDAALSVGAIAARHGITSRYVHMLFEAEGVTFLAFVTECRLTRAYGMLGDPANLGSKISTIAGQCGFKDLSWFNRVFRRRYGATPSDIRETALRRRR
jgi:AraC-like DNA-binding protein